MKSKIIKFLVIGLWIPSTISTSRADISESKTPAIAESISEPSAAAVTAPESEEKYSILMRARIGVQNWSGTDEFRSDSALSYGTDIGMVWQSGFGVLGHFWTGQTAGSGARITSKTRLSTLAIGPVYQLTLGKYLFQTHLFVGQLIVNEDRKGDIVYLPSGITEGNSRLSNDGYRVYGASIGVDVPVRDSWFANLLVEYGYVRPVSTGKSFAVNSLSSGVGYRF